MSANTQTLLLAPFDNFLVPYWGFFSFLCIWDVAHLNSHPFLPIFNHFYPFSIPHIELSPLWGPREGRGDVAIHSPRTLRSLWYGLHPHHISLAINKCVASTLRITTPLPFTLFAVPITQETMDNAFPALRVKGHLIRLQERSHGHQNTRSKQTLPG